ncbi:MAG TPA: cytochrome c maturation protein CcmE [Ginsengibacter sp.]|nr:cytochrome c maturation protein CcmE [Chitinophagaceae bacterium]HRN73894.1 cytochrome c maturation protein CcmE [Ginsengibacter sp.]HRP18422.1 cytochrome c maturation protein CcmE [Ginsengibacter sp.]HRP44538.1 cytochrome c maturation protein CcmE [Ginsengibacter sp.]
MKTSSIVILIAIAAAIGGLLMYSVDFSTYDTIQSAREKQGKYVHLIAKLDKSKPIQYDALKDPNYLSFYAVDSLGNSAKVVYFNPKPADLERSERVVLKGRMEGEVFRCDNILLKCPSKYKDEKSVLESNISQY